MFSRYGHKYLIALNTRKKFISSLIFAISILFLSTLSTSFSQFSILHTMNGGAGEGYIPFGKMAYDGTYLYGTNNNDFGGGYGTIFKMNPDGTGFTKIHQFTGGAAGTQPHGLLLIGSTLYGIANGGSNSDGIIYKINTDGTGFTIILDFDGTNNGRAPNSRLIYYNSALYGTTQQGGNADLGTIFKINTDGTGYQKLHDIQSGNYYTDMIEVNGVFYGSFGFGSIGGGNAGTLFKINPDGTGFNVFLDLNLNSTLGSFPFKLVNIGSTLYILTSSNGVNGRGSFFKVNTDGTGLTKIMDFGGANFQIQNLTLYGNVFVATATTTYSQYNNQEFFYWMNPDGTNQNLLYDLNPGGTIGAPAELSQGDPIVINGALYGLAHHGGDIAGHAYKFILPTAPIISTNSASSIDTTSATSGGSISSNGNAAITSKGIVWSLSQNPTTSSYLKISSNGTGSTGFTQLMDSLYSNTTYYVRSYATNFVGTSYGNQVAFTTAKKYEDYGPNNGDGNGDGIPDARQADVETILNVKTNTYMSVVNMNSNPILNIEQVNSNNESNILYPFGLLKFTVNQPIAKIKVYYHDIPSLEGYVYRKIDANGNKFTFNNVTFGAEFVNGTKVATATFTLYDGGREDFDGLVNGVIVDPGGPALVGGTAAIPIWDWKWRLFAIFTILIVGFWKFKNNI